MRKLPTFGHFDSAGAGHSSLYSHTYDFIFVVGPTRQNSRLVNKLEPKTLSGVYEQTKINEMMKLKWKLKEINVAYEKYIEDINNANVKSNEREKNKQN